MDLDRRSFVEKVDFITSVGYLDGGASREAAGLGPGGPRYVITDKAIFDFTPDTREMRLRSLHPGVRSEEHTSELQSLMRISYAVFCLKKKNNNQHKHSINKKTQQNN